MNAKSLITFFVCLNLAGMTIGALVNMDVLVADSTVMPYGASNIQSRFSPLNFSVENILYGLAGAGIFGLIGLITKQNVFAGSAAVIWIIGMFLNIGTWLTSGMGVAIDLLLTGTGLSFIGVVIQTFVIFIIFWWIAGTLTQRPDIG